MKDGKCKYGGIDRLVSPFGCTRGALLIQAGLSRIHSLVTNQPGCFAYLDWVLPSVWLVVGWPELPSAETTGQLSSAPHFLIQQASTNVFSWWRDRKEQGASAISSLCLGPACYCSVGQSKPQGKLGVIVGRQ